MSLKAHPDLAKLQLKVFCTIASACTCILLSVRGDLQHTQRWRKTLCISQFSFLLTDMLVIVVQAEQTEQAKDMAKALQQNFLRMKASSEKHIGRLNREVEVGPSFTVCHIMQVAGDYSATKTLSGRHVTCRKIY